MPAALAIPAAIGAAGSIGSAVIGSRASKKAADTQAAAGRDVAASARETAGGAASNLTDVSTTAANDIIRAAQEAAGGVTGAAESAATGVEGAATDANQLLANIYGDALGITSPYIEAGQEGLTSLADLVNEKFVFNQDDPSYQFRLQEGQKAIERSSAAAGGLQSGGTLKALTRYGQNFASTEYQNAFDRFLAERGQRAQTLAQLAGFGQTGVGQRLAAGQTYGTTASGNLMRAADTAGGYRLAGAESAGNFGLGGTQSAANTRVNAARDAGSFLLTGEGIAGNALTGAANASAAGTVGAANAWAQGLAGVNDAASSWLQYRTLRDIVDRGGAGPQINT